MDSNPKRLPDFVDLCTTGADNPTNIFLVNLELDDLGGGQWVSACFLSPHREMLRTKLFSIASSTATLTSMVARSTSDAMPLTRMKSSVA